MAAGDSTSWAGAGFLIRLPVPEVSDFEVVDSNRDFEVCDEMYSVLLKNEICASANLGFPKLAKGRNNARS